ncbi:hypothetical protein ACOSQ2_014727 [Xanthoceras sorbifolium]
MDPDEISCLCEKPSIDEDGVPKARTDPKLHEISMRKISLSLVGKIIANWEVNKKAFKTTIPKIWRTFKELGVESIAANTYIFIFKCGWDKKLILEGGPLCFDKQL